MSTALHASQDAFLRNMVVLHAVQSYVRDLRPDPALAGLGAQSLAALRAPDGLGRTLVWLQAFKKPLDLYERFRHDLVHGVEFPSSDVEKMELASTRALSSLRTHLGTTS